MRSPTIRHGTLRSYRRPTWQNAHYRQMPANGPRISRRQGKRSTQHQRMLHTRHTASYQTLEEAVGWMRLLGGGRMLPLSRIWLRAPSAQLLDAQHKVHPMGLEKRHVMDAAFGLHSHPAIRNTGSSSTCYAGIPDGIRLTRSRRRDSAKLRKSVLLQPPQQIAESGGL